MKSLLDVFKEYSNFQFLIYLILPGFITYEVLSYFTVRTYRKIENNYYFLLECISYSTLNFGINIVLFAIFKNIFFIIYFLISPIVLGIIFGFTYTILAKRTSIKPIPRAWDWVLLEKGKSWVIVTLKDNSQIYGIWGPGSYASNYPYRQDIYLESVCSKNEKDEIVLTKNTGGIYIKGEEIKYIEFFNTD